MKLKATGIGLICASIFFLVAGNTEAAYVYFEPAQKSVKINEQFDVLLKINTEGEKPTTTDVSIEYDNTNLTLVEIVQGSATERLFPAMYKRVSGKSIYVGSYANVGDTLKVGEGLLAILRFKGIKEAQSSVDILCTKGATDDTNVSFRKNGKVTDVVDCTKVVNGRYAISTTGSVPPATPTPGPIGGPQPTATPAPTAVLTPGVTVIPTATVIPTTVIAATAIPTMVASPSALPATGTYETTALVIIVGLSLTVISILIKVYVS